MAYKDFIKELNKQYDVSSTDELEGRRKVVYDFAASTNGRAREFMATIESLHPIDWEKARVLDIGCAYGGFCIETAKRGACSRGVDIHQGYLDLALANARDEDLDVDISLMDATSHKFREAFDGAEFNLIILNDVFEHVYDTATLVDNLSAAAADGCVLYFSIPNGTALEYIEAEGHAFIPGLTLLPPPMWSHKLKYDFSIYYRPWSFYLSILSFFGFNEIQLVNYRENIEDPEAYKRNLADEHALTQKKLEAYLEEEKLDKNYKKALESRLEEYRGAFEADLETMNPLDLRFKYQVDFWTGFAIKNGRGAEMSVRNITVEQKLTLTHKLSHMGYLRLKGAYNHGRRLLRSSRRSR